MGDREAGCSSAAHRRQSPQPPSRSQPSAPAGPGPPARRPLTSLHSRLRAARRCSDLRAGPRPWLRGGESRDPGGGGEGGGCPGPGPGVGSRSGAFSLFRCLKLAPAERCGHVTSVANQRRLCVRVRPGRRRQAGLRARRAGEAGASAAAAAAAGPAGEAAPPGWRGGRVVCLGGQAGRTDRQRVRPVRRAERRADRVAGSRGGGWGRRLVGGGRRRAPRRGAPGDSGDPRPPRALPRPAPWFLAGGGGDCPPSTSRAASVLDPRSSPKRATTASLWFPP